MSNVTTESRTLPFVPANLIGMGIFMISVLGLGSAYWLAHGRIGALSWLTVGAVFVSIFAHEGLHGLGYLLGGARVADVKIGFNPRAMMPYAHCRAALAARHYRVACLLPLVVLGVVPVVLAFALGSPLAIAVGIFQVGGAAGDLLVVYAIRDLPGSTRVLDHPTEIGCVVISDTPAPALG